MSWHRYEVLVEVDDDALAGHDGDQVPPPNHPSEWDLRDLLLAGEKELANLEDGEVFDYRPGKGRR